MQADQLFLETILRDMKEKKVIWSSQHGFTKGKSCLMNSVTLYSEMTVWVDEERAVDITSLISQTVMLPSRGTLAGWKSQLTGTSYSSDEGSSKLCGRGTTQYSSECWRSPSDALQRRNHGGSGGHQDAHGPVMYSY